MSKRKQPITSILAHESVKKAKAAMYVKIIEGMKKLRVGGNFEEIATASKLKPDQTWKRLTELVDMGICFNTGITHKTSSGRRAMVRQLTDLKNFPVPINVTPKEKRPTPPKNKPPQQQYIQNDLFFNTQTASWDNTIDRQ